MYWTKKQMHSQVVFLRVQCYSCISCIYYYSIIYLFIMKSSSQEQNIFCNKIQCCIHRLFTLIYTNINHKVVRWMNENQTILLKIIMLCYIALHLLVPRYFVCFFFCTFNKWKLLYIISLHSLVSQVPT